MISLNEIRRKAREQGVPISTVERDYAQNWLLKTQSSFPFALKGGTGIRKVYFNNYRFSDDLDFTLLEDIAKTKLERIIQMAIDRARDESGINFREDTGLKENVNGFVSYVYFQIMQRGNNVTSVKLDITKIDSEKILLPLGKKRIFHLYSDNLDAEIMVYALEEIEAEKIRSLFQRTRPRDLYDVWYLWDRVDQSKVMLILPEKFRVKGVKLDLKGLVQRKLNFKNAWETSLGYQMKNLPEFEEVFLSVVHKIENIIWD